MRHMVFARTRRGLVVRLTLVALVVALIVAFEIGVRQVTPDAVQYSVQWSINGGPIYSKDGTITNPATVARWRATMTATPSGKYIWQGRGSTCSVLTAYSISYVFFWHGLPVEVVTQAPFCGGGLYQISSGGIMDPRAYLIPPLVQP